MVLSSNLGASTATTATWVLGNTTAAAAAT